MSTYNIGDVVVVSVVFTAGENPVDPGGLKFYIRCNKIDEDTTYVYGTNDEVVKDDTGEYHVNVTPDDDGTWHYRWEGTGANAAAAEGEFLVRESHFV
jgi:hypothetical protein